MKTKSKKAKAESANYLDYVPMHNEDKYPFQTDDNGAVTIMVENKGVFNKIAQVVFRKPKNAVLKGAVQCYAVEGRYPESLSYLEQHYGVSYDKDKFIVSYEITGSNRMPQVTVIALNER